jgi:zinc protease
MFKTLYQNNPLAPVAVPHSEYFDQLDANRIIDIYKERFSNAYGMHFTLVGSFKEQEIMPLIEKYIASLPSKPYKVTYTDNKVRPVSGIKQLSFYKGKEQKSLILEFLNKEIPYSPELKLKATVLSDILNIRMIEELREKIQGIYGGGTSAEVEKLPYPHILFMVQLPCGPEKVDTLLKAVKAEFADMIAHGPEASYLEKVKKQLIEKYKVAVKENATWLQTLQQLHLQQGDPSYFLNYENYVNKLTAKDIQEAAKLILGSGNQFTAVLMPGKEEKTTEAKKGF